MTTGNPISPTSLAAVGSQGLAEQRETLQKRLREGATGGEIVLAFSDFMDALLIARFREVIQEEIVDISCNFRQPVLLPGRLELRKAPGVDRMVFELSDATDGRLHLFGTIRPGVPEVTGI